MQYEKRCEEAAKAFQLTAPRLGREDTVHGVGIERTGASDKRVLRLKICIQYHPYRNAHAAIQTIDMGNLFMLSLFLVQTKPNGVKSGCPNTGRRRDTS